MTCAEQIRAGIGALRVASGDGMVRLTISIGVASWPRDGLHGEELLRAADRALYRAKERGRDRVVRAS